MRLLRKKNISKKVFKSNKGCRYILKRFTTMMVVNIEKENTQSLKKIFLSHGSKKS